MDIPTEKKIEPGKIYVSFDIADAKISVILYLGWATLHIRSQYSSIEKYLVLDNKITEDFEKTLPMFKQFDNITFTIMGYDTTNIELFKKITYGLIAEKIVFAYKSLECLHKYLQHADTFVKINKLLFSKQSTGSSYIDFGENYTDEFIQEILDICCGLIEKEIITEIEIPHWDNELFHISDNVKAVWVYGNLFLTLGNLGDVTGKIEVINDEHEIAWENE